MMFAWLAATAGARRCDGVTMHPDEPTSAYYVLHESMSIKSQQI